MKFEAKVKKLEKSEIEVTITIPAEELDRASERAFNKLAKVVKVPGFREGKAPRETIMAKIGPALYEEMLNEVLPTATIAALEQEGLTPVDQIKYNVEKFEPKEELVYKATFPVYPEVKIGNLSKIKVKKETVKVTDEDVEKVLSEMFEDWSKREKAKATGKTHTHEDGTVCDHDHGDDVGTQNVASEDDVQSRLEKAAKEGEEKAVVLKYSEPTDEWAKDETHLDVADLKELKTRIKEEVTKQKEANAEAKYQNDIMAEAVKITSMEIPSAFIERELDRRLDQYKQRIAGFGLKLEDFLKAQQTDVEKLRDGWRDNAKAFIESELFLLQLSKDEEIKVADEEIQKQIDEVEDPKTKAQFENEQGREYIRQALLRQNAFKRLMAIVEGK